jgi:hypothetical protein
MHNYVKMHKNVKVHSSLPNAEDIYRGSKGMTPLILNPGTRWKSAVNFTSRNFYPSKTPQYRLKRKLGGPQSRCGHYEEETNLFPLPKSEPRNVQPVAESLYRLRYSGFLLNRPV